MRFSIMYPSPIALYLRHDTELANHFAPGGVRQRLGHTDDGWPFLDCSHALIIRPALDRECPFSRNARVLERQPSPGALFPVFRGKENATNTTSPQNVVHQ